MDFEYTLMKEAKETDIFCEKPAADNRNNHTSVVFIDCEEGNFPYLDEEEGVIIGVEV